GDARSHLRRWDEAVADLTEALQRAPEHPVVWAYRGVNQANRGRHKEAIDDLTHAIELRPDLDWGRRNRAISRAALRQWDGVAADAAKSRTLSPYHGQGWDLGGQADAERGRFKEAAALFARAAELNPGYYAHHAEHALASRAAGRGCASSAACEE